MLTHFNIVHSLLHYKYCFALGGSDRAVLAVPASHVTGVVAILLTIWHAQGCAVIMPEFKARDFLELAARERMSYTILVPAMYNLCLLQPDFDGSICPLAVGGYGGAPHARSDHRHPREETAAVGPVQCLRLEETTSPSTLMPAGRTAERPTASDGPCRAARSSSSTRTEGARPARPASCGSAPMVVRLRDDPEATRQSFTDGYWRLATSGPSTGTGSCASSTA